MALSAQNKSFRYYNSIFILYLAPKALFAVMAVKHNVEFMKKKKDSSHPCCIVDGSKGPISVPGVVANYF